MADNEIKKLHGRAELIEYFRNGRIPNETHFKSLIDSVIIQHDDGISKDEENGYSITSLGTSSKLITFYKNIDRLEPFFFVEKDLLDKPSLKFRSDTLKSEATDEEKSFYFHNDGSLGIGNKSKNSFKLDVNGFTASKGRTGTYNEKKEIPANGEWHDITPELDNCQVFEIVARAGIKHSGKFSIMHATALSAFGKSRSKIRKTRAYYGSFWSFWNKLNLRWYGTTHSYKLQMRSDSNFGPGAMIYYTICELWDDELFVPANCYYPKKQESFTDKQNQNKRT